MRCALPVSVSDISNEFVSVLKPSLMTCCSVKWLLLHVSVKVTMVTTHKKSHFPILMVTDSDLSLS